MPCSLQSAIAGQNARQGVFYERSAVVKRMLMSGSRAILRCEPCQGLTAAALSNQQDVPRGSFVGVVLQRNALVEYIEPGCAVF